jgi:hypothetical protein
MQGKVKSQAPVDDSEDSVKTIVGSDFKERVREGVKVRRCTSRCV